MSVWGKYTDKLRQSWGSRTEYLPPPVAQIGVLTIVALGLRLYTLPHRGVPTDEAITMWFVTRWSFTELAFRMPTTQPHYPTYYLLLKSWFMVTGSEAPMVARIPSIIAGAAIVPLAYGIATVLAKHRAGIVAATAITVSPFFIDLSQLIRMYALFTFFIGVSWWLFIRWHQKPTKRTLGLYVCGTVLMVYTHYFGLLFLLAQGAFHIWQRRGSISPRLIVALGTIGAPASVWVSYRIYWAASSTSRANVIGIPTRGLRQWVRLGLHPWLGQHLSMQVVNQEFRIVFPVLLGLALLAAAYTIHSLKITRTVRLVATGGGIPIGMLIIYTAIRKPILRPRYMAGAVLIAYITAAVATTRLDNIRELAVVIVILGGAVAGLPSSYADTGQMGWEAALSHVQDQADEGDYVIVSSPLPKSPEYHLNAQGVKADIATAHPAAAVDWGSESRDIWLIWRHPPSPAWENRGVQMKKKAASHRYTVVETRVENKIVVYHLTKDPTGGGRDIKGKR